MKKVLLATAMTMALGIVSSSALAEGVEGGQINFHGLVSASTCDTTVTSSHGKSTTPDGDVYLDTVAPVAITSTVQDAAPGTAPEPFSIVIDCSKSADFTATTATLTMASTFADTTGTLNNDDNVTINGVGAATNVDIAIHNADKNNKLVKVDGADAQTATFVANKATYNFIASYVLSETGKTPTPGHVTTNAMYTFTYN